MNVKQLIEELSELDPELRVLVMNDNGCRDPGYDTLTRVVKTLSNWQKEEVVFLESDF